MTTKAERDAMRKMMPSDDSVTAPYAQTAFLRSLLDEADELERLKGEWPYADSEPGYDGGASVRIDLGDVDSPEWPVTVMKKLMQPFHPIDAPTEPGWYWLDHWFFGSPYLGIVKLLESGDVVGHMEHDVPIAISELRDCQWYGPKIPCPQLPEPPQPEKTP